VRKQGIRLPFEVNINKRDAVRESLPYGGVPSCLVIIPRKGKAPSQGKSRSTVSSRTEDRLPCPQETATRVMFQGKTRRPFDRRRWVTQVAGSGASFSERKALRLDSFPREERTIRSNGASAGGVGSWEGTLLLRGTQKPLRGGDRPIGWAGKGARREGQKKRGELQAKW